MNIYIFLGTRTLHFFNFFLLLFFMTRVTFRLQSDAFAFLFLFAFPIIVTKCGNRNSKFGILVFYADCLRGGAGSGALCSCIVISSVQTDT